jgi:hypothetical protein
MVNSCTMKKCILFLSVAFIVFAACQQQAVNHAANSTTRALGPNDSLFRIAEGPYHFSLCLPKDMMINNTPQVQLNSATGELNIQMGERFHLVIAARQQDLAQIESDLKTDDLFTNQIVESDHSSLMYQQVLPTGETYSYQFCKNVTTPDGTPYFVCTSPMGEFSMESVSRMKQVVNTISSL